MSIQNIEPKQACVSQKRLTDINKPIGLLNNILIINKALMKKTPSQKRFEQSKIIYLKDLKVLNIKATSFKS